MADKFVSERNLKFLLYEVFDATSLTRHPYYADHSRESFDMALETALKIGKNLLKPKLQEMDKTASEFVDGRVKVHPLVRTFMKECGEGGWIAASFPFDLGGQQLPLIISAACRFIISAANYSASVYPMLTTGAAHLIISFGSQELQDAYLPKMLAGEWQGTMALTEPQAGSSLADITTLAEPTDKGYYRIRGQKIFISAGDHDGVDNVVHLMLAKIKGAPAGVRGISLLVVPQKRVENGGIVFNDVNTAGIYHKMGYRGAPITQLSMGENNDCRGWLVGEPHKGLSYMFQMMNEAADRHRLRGVGDRLRRLLRLPGICPAAAPGKKSDKQRSDSAADSHHPACGYPEDAPFPAGRGRRFPCPRPPMQQILGSGKDPLGRRERKSNAFVRHPDPGRQNLSVGDGDSFHQRRDAMPRGVRLLRRVSLRALLPRCAHSPHP